MLARLDGKITHTCVHNLTYDWNYFIDIIHDDKSIAR